MLLLRKKNEQREEQYQKVIENQAVIEEQAKAFGSLSKDVSDIKQKLWGMVTTNEKSIKLLASISTAYHCIYFNR